MLRPLLAALGACAAALSAAAAEPPRETVACVSKDRYLAPAKVMGGGFPADFRGEVEANFIINLLRFEAVDLIGRDVVIVRHAGYGLGRIIAFRDGCFEREIHLPNLHIEVLERFQKEEGV